MRDANRLKEKIDLSLDNRQVMSLVIGGIVVLGAVFVVGVVVGKKLSTSERASGAPDLLTALDQRATAMDEATDASLTFQDELTKKAAEAPRIEAPAAPAAVATKLDPAPAPLPKPESVGDPEPVAPVVAAAPRADEAVPTRTVLKDGGGMKEAIARSQRPVEAAANGAFSLQLSASQDRDEADRFMAKLKGQGYAPYIVEAQVPGRGTWYRVRMGSFPTKEAAGRYLQDFRRETQMEAFVAGGEAR
jgi:cell division septation protein DedD